MLRSLLLLIALVSQSYATPALSSSLAACQAIAANVSSASSVYYAPSINYLQDVSHYALTNQAATTACSVQPGNAQDVSAIIKIIGIMKVPFAIKGGGHAMNAGFSSTPGVQITMKRFNQVTYHKANSSVDIGPGLIWDDVYSALESTGVNVVGGRVTGVGCAGLLLGGGYSWKSNQYGLGIDNILEYTLVKPDGSINYVNAQSDPDVFFALKGGFNNFGVVTNFNVRAVPQTQVFGGVITYTFDHLDALMNASALFSATNSDKKAQVIVTLNFILGQPGASLLVFYDAPTAPAGTFDAFTAIPAFTTSISTRSYLSLVQSAPVNLTTGMRGLYMSANVHKLDLPVLQATLNETKYWGEHFLLHPGSFISYDIEPFLSSYFDYSQGGGYPHSSANPLLPINLYYGWDLPTDDEQYFAASKYSAQTIVDAAVANGQNVGGSNQIIYPNYALADIPLEQMYGSNVARLKSIKQKVDPQNVMGLAGGFKF